MTNQTEVEKFKPRLLASQGKTGVAWILAHGKLMFEFAATCERVQGGSLFTQKAKEWLGYDKSTASMWRTIGEHHSELFDNVKQLPSDYKSVYEIAIMPAKQRAAVVHPKVTRVELRRAKANATTTTKATGRRATPDEIARRRPISVRLWGEGLTRDTICDALGVSHGTLKEDLVAMGVEGRRFQDPFPGKQATGEIRWRSEDTNAPPPEETAPSRTVNHETAYCRLPSATQLIDAVQSRLEELTSGRYELSLRDRTRSIGILQSAIERITAHGISPSKNHTTRTRAGAFQDEMRRRPLDQGI